MPCLGADHPLVVAIREGRRTGTLTLEGFQTLVAHLRAHGHPPRLIAVAAELGCGSRPSLENELR